MAQEHLLAADPSVAELVHAIQQWADATSAELGPRVADLLQAMPSSFDLVPPAYAADAAPAVELDPNQKYIFGADGNVLIDPATNKPITDDWWNGLIGFQTEIIKAMDGILRQAGVKEAFGWTIVLYTFFVKVLFYPLQQSQLKSTSMMQLLSPKVKEIQERYKDDPETQSRLIGQVYQTMEVNPLGGCLPLFLQLPLFWSLYGVWRRLSAEKFPHYEESWLWVPSLAQPNPDFQFKLDWLWEYTAEGVPTIGWEVYLKQLIFPVILIAFTVISQQQSTAAKPKTEDGKEDENLVLKVLPFVSIYFIGALSMELPQAVSVYYATNTVLTLAQTNLVKYSLRQEIPGYEEFEKTGKFPDSAFDDVLMASTPAPTNLHEAALRGNVAFIKDLYEGDAAKGVEPGEFDINAWDEKEIAPIGYAVACGHLDAVKYFLEKGANVQVMDGQKNTLLHYAAGYGHQAVLEELLVAGADTWPNNEWSELKNNKGQTVMDAARVNRKGSVLDYLCDRLGIDATTIAVPPPKDAKVAEDAKAEEGKAVEAEVIKTSSGKRESPQAAKARAALLASVEKEVKDQQEQAAEMSSAATAMRDAVSRLKANPEQVEQARKMMGKMPPQLLSMLTGNKMTAEQATEAQEKWATMSTEDLLQWADGTADLLAQAGKKGVPTPAPAGPDAAAPKSKEGSAVPARAVD